ncbi:MAG: nqo5 [Gammaproteobacteria bacterium]|nr:nqo5 [Gammaproteobacteria bacterium]
MLSIEELAAQVTTRFNHLLEQAAVSLGELTIIVAPQHLRELCFALRDDPDFNFKLLIDICGVDYLQYGVSEWTTNSATATGFERGVECQDTVRKEPRFASVYHLLSLTHNQRLRIRVPLNEARLEVPSVMAIWPAANWFEREAFDLFGIVYSEHPDLRRILTDYGFVGHPFRKDFPLSGNLEVRYDAKLQRVVYEPVSIEPRVLEPKVIRRDNRYQVGDEV